MKQKLHIRFHNPNTTERTIEYITKILIEANAPKLERAIQAYAEQKEGTENIKEEESLCR